MSINDYTPSEIEIRNLGIGLIDTQYLDLDTREYLVIGDTHNDNETVLEIGQQHTNYWSNYGQMLPRDIKYSMIVNNSGIGINTSRSLFDSNFALNSKSGIYIENGDIVCKGNISAKNLTILNEEGIPYNLNNILTSSNIINDFVTAINSNVTISKFSQGWVANVPGTNIKKNNIYTENYINIGASSIDTIDNLHPVNIVSSTANGTMENIHIAIKNKAMSEPNIYTNPEVPDEKLIINEPSSLKMGIIGNNSDSPAIISTTKGMPLEFHVSKPSIDINKLYNPDNSYIIPNLNNPQYSDSIISNYPAMTITSEGSVSIGKNTIDTFTSNNINIDSKLQVTGASLFDKIYIKDYKSSTDNNPNIFELDDIYYRKVGINFKADQIEPGDFSSGNYKFKNNLEIENDLIVNNNLIINKELTIQSNLNANKIVFSNLNIRSNDTSEFNCPVEFKEIVTYEDDVNVSGNLFYHGYRLNALNIEKMQNLIDNGDGTFETEFGSNLTQQDIEGNVILYYGINSNSTVRISGSNLAVPGKLAIGINDTESFNNNQLTIKNQDLSNFEICIEDSNTLDESILNKTHIGHIILKKNNNDKSLIINTSQNHTNDIKRNIYFYPGTIIDDITKNNSVAPTLSIHQNNSVGINLDILNTPTHALHVNGDILGNNLFINKNGIAQKAQFFLQDDNLVNNNAYFLNIDNQINKYFINYNNTNDTNRINKSKGLNIIGGINSVVNDIHSNGGGYYENNIRLATFRYINANSIDSEPKTSYTNTNIFVGIDDLSEESKNSYINPNNTKPLMIRNLSLNDYNDTVIRLYRGKSNRTNNSDFNKANFTGIDFCNWTPITGNKNTEKWYIYRNHNEYIQTDNNYPGILQFGYTDNTYHPNKAGLEIMYRRNNDTTINTANEITENDQQNYYFIFNRDKNTSLPNDSSISTQKTVKIYGDLDVTGTVHCDKVILAGGIEVSQGTNGTQISTSTNQTNPEVIQSQNDIELSGNLLSWLYSDKTVIGLYDSNIVNFINTNKNDIQNNVVKNTLIYQDSIDHSIASFVKPYNNINIADFDLKLKYFDDNNSFDVNTVSFSLESHNNFTVNPLDIKPVYPSIFSLKNKLNKKFISFYNSINNTYINIGSHNNVNYYNPSTSNISLHIQDYSKYLLQLTNDNSSEFARINFHKKTGNLNHFWIFEGPTHNNNFNIQYANNNNNSLVPDNINTIITLNKNKNIGINEINPIYPLHVKSDDNTSMKLINNYSDTNNTFNNNNNFSLIEIFNSNLNINSTLNILNNNIIFAYNVNIESDYIPDYNINSNIVFEAFKNSSNYIKTINYNNNNSIKYNILLPNEINNHSIAFNQLNSNYFIFDNTISTNYANPNIIDINNDVILPSYSYSNVHNNYSNISFKLNNNNLITNDLNSNLLILFNGETQERAFNIKNNYTYLNTLNFTSNITNYTYNFDETHNLHLYYNNIILDETDNDTNNATEFIIYTNSNYIENHNLNIFTSNYLLYDPNITKNSDIDIILNLDTNYNTSINIPTTIFNNNVKNHLINNYYDNNNSINIVNLITSNYLKENIIGTKNNIPIISDFTDETIFNYNISNIDYIFNNTSININNRFLDIKVINNYEKYIDNVDKHYLFTNVINDIPHIILENNLTNYNSNYNIGGINKLYSTNDGNFKINYEDINNNIDKTLINLNKDGNIKIENGSLYVDYIFVDNIFDKNNGNSIILNNSNRLDNQGHFITTSNYNLMTSNINFTSSNINLNINGDNFDSFNIKKSGVYIYDTINSNIHNNIINIDYNNDIITDFKNAFSLSTLENTVYTTIGKDTNAKIGIGKDIDNLLYSLDVNGQIRSSANNVFNNQEPHIILDTDVRNVINGSKIYNNNLIYSDNGKFKVTALNTYTSYEKDLIVLDNGNIKSDSISTNDIHTNNIFDLNGNSLIPGFENLNNNEFIYNISNLHIRSSNVQFTTSNINIAIEKDKNNYFNINKIRPKEIDDILIDNILSFNIDTTFPYLADQNIIYSSLVQIDNTTFLSSVYNNGDNLITKHILNNSSPTTESGLVGNSSYTDGDRLTEASYGIISEIVYDNINNLLFIVDKTHKHIRVINYSTNQVYSLGFTYTDSSDPPVVTPITLNNPVSLTISADKNTLYFSDNNKIYSADLTSIQSANYNLDTIIINDNTSGYEDGIQDNAKFTSITSMYVDNYNTFLYVADNGAYSIRKINLFNYSVTTIAGYPPNSLGSRSGIAIGDGNDARFNNIKKIMLSNDNKFLIILDYSETISRILSLDINTNYVSTIYSSTTLAFDNLLIDTINNNIIYIITLIDIYKLQIIDYTLYEKNIILDISDNNNIFSITSIPHDAINIPYYSMDNDFTYNFSNEMGYINSMSVKTNKKSTIVQFGTNNEYENAYIGISTEPVIGTELTVNGFIDASNLNISNCINTTDLYVDNSYLKCVYGYNNTTYSPNSFNTILYDANIIPKEDSIYNIGSYNNKFGDIYIGNANDINIGTLKLKNTNDYLTLYNYNDEYTGININDIKFKNKNNMNYNSINLDFYNNLFSIKSYDENNNPLVGFNIDIIEGTFTTSNVNTTGDIISLGIIQSGNAEFTILDTDIINISNNLINHYGLYSSNIETNYININNNLICSNNSLFLDDIICDTNIFISCNLTVINDINVSNLYVSSNVIINENLISSNNVNIFSNLSVGKTITATDINVNGTITAENLNIQGATTTISTSTYTTENLEIISSTPFDDASLKIIHTIDNINNFNMLESSNQYTNDYLIIDKNAKIGINKSPDVELDIIGDIRLTGSINNLSHTTLNNLESLDDDILTKFQNSSNYSDNINSNILNTSNYINTIYNKLIDITNKDYLSDPKHPIVKEYDNDNNLINTFSITDYVDNDIFYKSSTNDNEYYIVLRNNSDYNQKHYKLSFINNLLADILLVGGGGSGKNIDINQDFDTRIGTKELLKQLNPTNDILLLTTCIDFKNEYLFYNIGTSIYYSSIYDLNVSTLLFTINCNYGSFNSLSVSNDLSIIAVSCPNAVYINYLNNFVYNNTLTVGLSGGLNDHTINFGNINGNPNDARFNMPLGIALSNNNEFIIVCDMQNNSIKKIDVNTGFVTLIAGSTDGTSGFEDDIGTDARFTLPIKVCITSDDNFAYIYEYGVNMLFKIRKINLKNNHVTLFKNLSSFIPRPINITLSPDNKELAIINANAQGPSGQIEQPKINKYNIDNDTFTYYNINKTSSHILYDIVYTSDSSSMIYLSFENIDSLMTDTELYKVYNKPFDIINTPAPGGAGSVLYRNDCIIPKGIYDIYVGNGGKNNENGYNTIGFGGTSYGGSNAYINYNNLNIPGDYNGYNIENSYIIENNIYDNLTYTSSYTNGGTAATNINSNLNYNGFDGFKANFIENEYQNIGIPLYYGGGAGSYDIINSNIGLKGLGGGTNSINIFNPNNIYTSNIIHSTSNSGGGASGGLYRILSLYPIIDNIVNDSGEKILTSDPNSITIEDYINIDLNLYTQVSIFINNGINQKCSETITNFLKGSYQLIINNSSHTIKLKDIQNNTFIIDSTSIGLIYNSWSLTNGDPHLTNSSACPTDRILINISYTIANQNDNLDINFDPNNIINSSNLSINDSSVGGSGIVILKYDINREAINSIEDKLDKRLRLLEESLSFSRINSYNNIVLKYYKTNVNILYSNIYLDQSYNGIVVDFNTLEHNTVNSNYKYVWKIKFKTNQLERNVIPDTISQTFNYTTNSNIINFRNILFYPTISENQYLYIDNINLQIYDNVYSPSNNAYISNFNYSVNMTTPSINVNYPLSNDMFISRQITRVNSLYNNSFVPNNNYYEITSNGNEHVISLNYNSLLSNDNQTEYQLILSDNISASILIVAGGGSGGGSTGHMPGGGGGGGGVLYSETTLLSGIYNIKVGNGGVSISANNDVAGTSGASSQFNDTIVYGGGGGGSKSESGKDGGSGGGAAQSSSDEARGEKKLPSYGSVINADNSTYYGQNGNTSSATNTGNGGSSLYTSDIYGFNYSYSTGGSGQPFYSYSGGSSFGSDSTLSGQDGNNYGDGGDGAGNASNATSGAGQMGVVIVKFTYPNIIFNTYNYHEITANSNNYKMRWSTGNYVDLILNEPYLVFNNDIDIYGEWQKNQYSNGNYNLTSNKLNISSTEDNNFIYGDWIIIKLNEKIMLTDIEFLLKDSIELKEWYIGGINDLPDSIMNSYNNLNSYKFNMLIPSSSEITPSQNNTKISIANSNNKYNTFAILVNKISATSNTLKITNIKLYADKNEWESSLIN